MAVNVTPNSAKNTHHIKLDDGADAIGLILCDSSGKIDPRGYMTAPINRQSIKFYTGEQQLSDLEPPWQDVVQSDFSAGRGHKVYDENTSGYWDGLGINTLKGSAIVGPLPQFSRSMIPRTRCGYWPSARQIFDPNDYDVYGYGWHALYGDQTYLAAKIQTPGTAYDGTEVYLYAFIRNPAKNMTKIRIAIAADNSGVPADTNLASADATLSEFYNGKGPQMIRVRWPTLDLAASTYYWVIAYTSDGTPSSTDHAVMWGGSSTSSSAKKATTRTGGWTTSYPMYVNVVSMMEGGKLVVPEFRGHFGEIRNCLYMAAEYGDGRTGKVFQCGTQGAATGGSTTDLLDTNNTVGFDYDNIYNGGVLQIEGGYLGNLPCRHRMITGGWGSPTYGVSTYYYPFPAAPTAGQEYVVMGTDYWREVTGHGMSGYQYITDALSAHGGMYFAGGPQHPLMRLRNFWGSSTYWQWTDETGTYFTFLESYLDAYGVQKVAGATRILPPVVYSATAVDLNGSGAASALTFSGENVGDLGQRITGLATYGETYPELWCFKEGSLWRKVQNVWQELRIAGFHSSRDLRNGYISCVHDVYLFFTFLNSLERYYNGTLDDVGPAKDGGLPWTRKGMISGMASYMGGLYAMVDNDYAYGVPGSLQVWNGIGWHELWRSPIKAVYNERSAGKVYVQPLPGDHTDRLYTIWNGEIVSFSVDGDPYNKNESSYHETAAEYVQPYTFAPGGSLTTGWHYFGLKSVDKLFHAVSVYGTNLGSQFSQLELEYRVDDDADFIYVGQFTIDNDQGKLELDPTYHNITGKRIQLRITLLTKISTWSPRLLAYVVEGVAAVPGKEKVSFTCRIEDHADDLVDQPDDHPTADAKLAHLRAWALSAGTIAMSGHVDELNNKRVKVDYPSLSHIKHFVEEVGGRKRNVYVINLEAWIMD